MRGRTRQGSTTGRGGRGGGGRWRTRSHTPCRLTRPGSTGQRRLRSAPASRRPGGMARRDGPAVEDISPAMPSPPPCGAGRGYVQPARPAQPGPHPRNTRARSASASAGKDGAAAALHGNWHTVFAPPGFHHKPMRAACRNALLGALVGSGPRYRILSHVFARFCTCKNVRHKSYTSGHCLARRGAAIRRGKEQGRAAARTAPHTPVPGPRGAAAALVTGTRPSARGYRNARIVPQTLACLLL